MRNVSVSNLHCTALLWRKFTRGSNSYCYHLLRLDHLHHSAYRSFFKRKSGKRNSKINQDTDRIRNNGCMLLRNHALQHAQPGIHHSWHGQPNARPETGQPQRYPAYRGHIFHNPESENKTAFEQALKTTSSIKRAAHIIYCGFLFVHLQLEYPFHISWHHDFLQCRIRGKSFIRHWMHLNGK